MVDDLRSVSTAPSFLCDLGFDVEEEESSDDMRYVWYELFLTNLSQSLVLLQVEFKLRLYDLVDAHWDENHQYAFNKVYLVVRNQSNDYERDDPDSRQPLTIHKVSEIKQFLALFQAAEDPWE